MKTVTFRRLLTFALVALFVAVSLIPAPALAATSSPAGTPQQVQTAASTCTYIVKYGDTLFGLAARYHTSIWELMRINNIYSWSWLYAGQTLHVPCETDGGSNPNCTYRAAYVADVTVPDHSNVIAGSHFPKIWRVANTGTCVWGPGHALHSLTWVGGTQMGAPASVEIDTLVYPGHQVDLVVPMVAPSLAGHYLSEWKLKVDGGSLVGVGAFGVPLYVDFYVPGSFPPPAKRIQFAPGTNSLIVNEATKNGQVIRYVVGARGGQTMSVHLIGIVPTPATIAISGARDGQLLLPGVYGRNGFDGTLPSTQDYFIDVIPDTNATVNYALQVTIK